MFVEGISIVYEAGRHGMHLVLSGSYLTTGVVKVIVRVMMVSKLW